MATLDSIAKDLKSMRKMLRRILGDIDDPTGEKKEARARNNGFNKPQVVSAALRTFLHLGPDEMVSRSQVTKSVNAYVTEKNLKNGKVIVPDEALKTLLQVPEGVQVTFLNLQKYLNQHYVKTEAEPVKIPETPVVETEKKASRPKVAKKTAA